MLTIQPLSQVPSALPHCIGLTDREWSGPAGYSISDWEAEFTRISEDPVDEFFVAMEGDKPVGMVWLLENEGIDSLSHMTP